MESCQFCGSINVSARYDPLISAAPEMFELLEKIAKVVRGCAPEWEIAWQKLKAKIGGAK